MEQVLFGGFDNALKNSATEYSSLVEGIPWVATESNTWGVVSTSGKIKNLRVRLDDSPGADTKYTFTLMLNGAPSALTLEIADAATSGADTTHEVDVVASDIISLRCVPTDTPTVRKATWTSMFEGATPKESLIIGGTNTFGVRNEYASVMGPHSEATNDENEQRQLCPTSGKIKNLYVTLSEDPGDIGVDGYRFTLRKGDGAMEDTTLTVTITADDTTGHDIDHEVTVAAGDVLTMRIEPLNVPSEEPMAFWGMTFVADIDGESVILAGNEFDTLPAHGDAEYAPLQSSSYPLNNWRSTESSRLQLGQSCILKKFYVRLSGAPGDGDYYGFYVRVALAISALYIKIEDLATTGNDVVHEVPIADDEYVSMYSYRWLATTRTACWGLVCYIAPPPLHTGNIAAKMVAAGLI